MDERLLIIIPAFNEELKIGTIINKTRDMFPDIDILLVNDSSTDKTPIIAKDKGVRVISHPFNLGYGCALQTGYKYAVAANYDYVVQMDADGQHDPQFIKCLVDELLKDEADLILGSRYLDVESYKVSLPRKMGVAVFSEIILWITGKKITDPTSGFQAMNRKVVDLYVSEYFPVDYPDADIIIFLLRKGMRIKEIPVRMYANNNKSMHSGLKPIYYIIKMFLVIFIGLLRYKKED